VLHLLAAHKERRLDRQRATAEADGFFAVAKAAELRESEGKIVVADGKRFALFVQGKRVFALSNVCRHQGGPIGEGRIVFNCITCPWHGFQYKAEDGCSPPPFTEVLPTYPVRIVGDAVYLSPKALPPGTKSEGAPIKELERLAPTDARGGTRRLPEGAARDFYIGWQSKCAPALAAFSRRAVFALALLVPAVVGAVVWFQRPVDRGRFEFGVEKQFEGVLYEHPMPRLRLTAPNGRQTDHVLVGTGKFGPPAIISGANGHRVRFSGSIIVREPLHMIEISRPESFTILDRDAVASAGPSASLLGQGRFIGELVDTKCHSGVMRPATGKVHRGCAIRCLSGGVPPGLLVRDGRGDGVVFLLAGSGDEPLRYDVQLAGTLIEVEGRLEWSGDTPVLRVESLKPR
jgi:nitrite reductase/ring-hydroxylating ferredoxin subunit